MDQSSVHDFWNTLPLLDQNVDKKVQPMNYNLAFTEKVVSFYSSFTLGNTIFELGFKATASIPDIPEGLEKDEEKKGKKKKQRKRKRRRIHVTKKETTNAVRGEHLKNIWLNFSQLKKGSLCEKWKDIEPYSKIEMKDKIIKWKKKKQRIIKNQYNPIKYTVRQKFAQTRVRVGGKFVKKEEAVRIKEERKEKKSCVVKKKRKYKKRKRSAK